MRPRFFYYYYKETKTKQKITDDHFVLDEYEDIKKGNLTAIHFSSKSLLHRPPLKRKCTQKVIHKIAERSIRHFSFKFKSKFGLRSKLVSHMLIGSHKFSSKRDYIINIP